jgi:UDP-N-acetylmuramoyl-tripeptide--D-alanyl-D-alanine ligase
MAKRFKNPLFYPAKGDYYYCEFIEADPFVRLKAENGREIQTQLIGRYNYENIAAALCIGKFFDVKPELAHQAVVDYKPDNMRSQVLQKGTNTIILDAYNANPSSMLVAINTLAEMNAHHKVLILGDMFELESDAEREHRELGRLIKEVNFDQVYLCGAAMAFAKEEYPKAMHFHSKEDLIRELTQNPIVNATILIKASRGIGLESVAASL